MGEEVARCPAKKQQAKRKKAWKGECEYPLVIRRDVFKVKELGLKVAKWWARVPVFGGGIWCPIQLPFMQEQLLKEDIRETQLRKRLGNEKALKTIKKVGRAENRKVNAVLHNISRAIVDRAKELNAVILLGAPNGASMRRK